MNVKEQFLLLAAGAVLGGLVTELIDAIGGKGPIVVIAAVVVLLVAVLLGVTRLLGPLGLIFASAGGCQVAGRWSGSFEYEKNGAPVRIMERLEISQRGRHVRGRSESTSVSGDFPLAQTEYVFVATLNREGVLDGKWRNLVGQRYYGLFQGKVRRSNAIITGTWLGIDDERINRGEFEWRRVR